MNKRIFAVLVSLIMLVGMTSAMAEAAVPSVTLGGIVSTTGEAKTETTEEAPALVIYLQPAEVTVKEQKVLEEIKQHVESKPVAEFFAPEVLTAAIELLVPTVAPEAEGETEGETEAVVPSVLPEEIDPAALQMDEFFALKTEGYDAEHGDVEVAFEFYTEYTPETKLVGMVGILPLDAAEGEEAAIIWIPVQASVIDGKVVVTFTQEVLEKTLEHETVFALLSVK